MAIASQQVLLLSTFSENDPGAGCVELVMRLRALADGFQGAERRMAATITGLADQVIAAC
jgi:hypothetical protein